MKRELCFLAKKSLKNIKIQNFQVKLKKWLFNNDAKLLFNKFYVEKNQDSNNHNFGKLTIYKNKI